MIEEGILPDETKKDKLAVAITQLQQLAVRWGLPQKDPEFTKKYTSERALCQFLAEYTAVIDLERDNEEVSGPQDSVAFHTVMAWLSTCAWLGYPCMKESVVVRRVALLSGKRRKRSHWKPRGYTRPP